MLSPIMWNQFMACFVILFAGLASALTRRRVSRRAVWTGVASYVLISAFGNLHGYPFARVTMVEHRLLPIHPYVAHVLDEVTTGSLILLLLSAYWFTAGESGISAQPATVRNAWKNLKSRAEEIKKRMQTPKLRGYSRAQFARFV
jgi:hypothetical protein